MEGHCQGTSGETCYKVYSYFAVQAWTQRHKKSASDATVDPAGPSASTTAAATGAEAGAAEAGEMGPDGATVLICKFAVFPAAQRRDSLQATGMHVHMAAALRLALAAYKLIVMISTWT